jgi:hypothetical protein
MKRLLIESNKTLVSNDSENVLFQIMLREII